MLPDALTDRLEPHLPGPVEECAPIGGGCIANGCRLEAGGAPLFLKWGDEEVACTFAGEAAGLAALRTAESPLRVPEVRATADAEGEAPGFLLMEWIPSGRERPGFWSAFGRGLAQLHRHASEDGRYGFAGDNFIGRLPQANGWAERWPAFFRARRLAPQAALAREKSRWRAGWDDAFDALCRRLPDLLPAAPPASILHGDLWSGNAMTAADGTPVLIDPAAYHGHREADLAMTQLFGGFQQPFYDAYREAWPLDAGYAERRPVYNLYHLINHLNHFGGSYAAQVGQVLKRFAA